jgi:hypothetical protein
MTSDDYDWERRSEIFPRKRYEKEQTGINPLLPTLRNTPSYDGATTAPPNLNITQGLAGNTIEFLIGQKEQQTLRNRAAKKRKAGQTTRDGFKRLKSLKAAGQMIAHTGDFEIGINTLMEVNRRAAIKQAIKDEEQQVKDETYIRNKEALNDLRRKKPEQEDWTKPEILTALRAVKKTGDKANPSKKEDLLKYWQELSHRIPIPAVAKESEAMNREGFEVVEESLIVVERQSDIGLNVKEGANEICSTAL